MYAKFISETEIQIAPVNFVDDAGRTYLNFNLSPGMMAQHKFKPLDDSGKPDTGEYDITYVDQGDVIKAVYNQVVITKTEAEIKQEFINAVQDHMDSIAQTRGYDDIFTACTYATSTVERFVQEAQACVRFRDAVWSYCYEQLDKIMAGTRTMPSIIEFIEELPKMEW